MIRDTEATICPINWSDYRRNVRAAIDIICGLQVPDNIKERLYALLEVEDFSGWRTPEILSWNVALHYAHLLVPGNASVPEVDKFEQTLTELSVGTT